jgi:hypothetical protein
VQVRLAETTRVVDVVRLDFQEAWPTLTLGNVGVHAIDLVTDLLDGGERERRHALHAVVCSCAATRARYETAVACGDDGERVGVDIGDRSAGTLDEVRREVKEQSRAGGDRGCEKREVPARGFFDVVAALLKLCSVWEPDALQLLLPGVSGGCRFGRIVRSCTCWRSASPPATSHRCGAVLRRARRADLHRG